MGHQIFTPFFDDVDLAINAFVTETSSRIITELVPLVTIGMTISFMTFGLLIAKGVVAMPAAEFLKKMFSIALITSFALSVGTYQKEISELIQQAPDQLVNVLMLSSSQENKISATVIIDQVAESGFDKADRALENASFFSTKSWRYAFIGAIIFLATAVFVSIGGTILLLTKISLSILASLGPFFIAALLWKPTARFFNLWIAQVMNFVILLTLYAIVFGLLLKVFDACLTKINFDKDAGTTMSASSLFTISIAMIYILLQMPRLASALAGGISLDLSSASTLSFLPLGLGNPNIASLTSKGLSYFTPNSNQSGQGALNSARGLYRGSAGKNSGASNQNSSGSGHRK